MEHTLKISTQYFEPVSNGIKSFEIRKNDRNFQANDILFLKEYDEENNRFTGRSTRKKITYISSYQQKEGWVVLSIAPLENLTSYNRNLLIDTPTPYTTQEK